MRGAKRTRTASRASLILGVIAALWPASAAAADEEANADPDPLPVEHGEGDSAEQVVAPRLNMTGRFLTLDAPVMLDRAEIARIDILIDPTDAVLVSVPSMIDALEDTLSPARLSSLRAGLAGRDRATLIELQTLGVPAAFNSETLSLDLQLAPDARSVRRIPIMTNTRPSGEFAEPARVSAYANVRASFDHEWDNQSGRDERPAFFIDGAARMFGVVLEGEGGYRPAGVNKSKFVRDGTRLVYDDRDRMIRWTAGDLLTEGRGFQGAPEMLGISISRSYRELDPTRNVFPRGRQAFTLQRPATVDVRINGQNVQTLRLDPGAYELSDFPFYSGANNVELLVEDDTGRRDTVSFDLFFDRDLLDPGVREFGAYAGVASFPSLNGPDYDQNRLQISAFGRAGIRDDLTLGANIQGDEFVQQVGVEALWATPIGIVGLDVAASNAKEAGSGAAVNGILQARFGAAAQAQSMFVGFDYRTEDFATLGDIIPTNPFAYEVYGGYNRSLSENVFFSASARYSAARGAQADVADVRVGLTRQIGREWIASAELVHLRRQFEEDNGIRLGISRRFGPRTSARAIYDSALERGSVDLYTSHGDGVGAWQASADVQTDEAETVASGGVRYSANRGDITLDHRTPLRANAGEDLPQRTSVRIASSFAFADGRFGVGRPIYDAFVLAAPHRTLDAEVELDLRNDYYEGRSGLLGAAIAGNIGSYTDRTISYTAPDAPAGYDLGAGSIRTFAPYRAGYKIVAGSDYATTATGRLVDQDGQAIRLLAGSAIELSEPDRAPVALFTNREGRFGLSGLRPGRWRIVMPTHPASHVEIEISETSEPLVSLGDLQLE